MSNQKLPLSCPSNSAVCRAFCQAAVETRFRLSEASRLDLNYGEETVTDSVLLDLSLKCGSRVYCRSYKKWQEAQNGADWELWFRVGSRGVGCRIQAKRLYPEGRYRALALKPRSKIPSQLQRLMSVSRTDRRTPLYVFFTYPAPGMTTNVPPTSGCLVARASAVAGLRNTSFAQVHKIAKPWHALVCICGSAGDRLSRIHDNLRNLPGGTEGGDLTDICDLPDYVKEAAETIDGESGSAVEPGTRPDFMPPKSVRGLIMVNVASDE